MSVIPFGADYDERGNRIDAADAYDQAHGDPEEPWPEDIDSSDEGGVSRARNEPPLVISVRSVRNPRQSHTSNSRIPTPKSLTSASHTSNVSHTPPADLLTGVRNGEWLTGKVFDPLRFAVPDILPEGFAVLAGPPKAGKSWVVLDWVLSVAAGGRALGRIPVGPARPVLYFALEDSDRRMQGRCKSILMERAIPGRFSYITRIEPHQHLAMIRAFLGKYPETGLVAIDTLGKVMPPMMNGETTYQRDYRVGSDLHRIAHDHPGLAVVVVHHTRKSISTDFVDSVSGTNGLAGAADTVIVLTRERNSNEGLLQVTGRDIEEAEYALTSDGGRWTVDGKDLGEAAAAAHERKDLDNLGAKSRDIASFVAEHPEGVSAKDVAEKFGKSAYEYLRRLTDNGDLEKPSRGYYCTAKGKAA